MRLEAGAATRGPAARAAAALGRDPVLAALISRHGPYAPPRRPFASAFVPLARSIVYQQLSGRAAATIHARLAAAFGDGATPDPRRVGEAGLADLRAVGLSRRKAEYLKALGRAACAGALPGPGELAKLEDEAVIAALTVHRGVGRWTVQMILMAWMGRPDVMPADDLGVRKGLQRVEARDRLPSPGEVLRRAEAWRPFRSIAAWYLWRAAEAGPQP